MIFVSVLVFGFKHHVRFSNFAPGRRREFEQRERLSKKLRCLVDGSLLLRAFSRVFEADDVHARDLELQGDACVLDGDVQRAMAVRMGPELTVRVLGQTWGCDDHCRAKNGGYRFHEIHTCRVDDIDRVARREGRDAS